MICKVKVSSASSHADNGSNDSSSSEPSRTPENLVIIARNSTSSEEIKQNKSKLSDKDNMSFNAKNSTIEELDGFELYVPDEATTEKTTILDNFGPNKKWFHLFADVAKYGRTNNRLVERSGDSKPNEVGVSGNNDASNSGEKPVGVSVSNKANEESSNEALMFTSKDDCIDLDGMECSILAKVKDLSVITDLLKYMSFEGFVDVGLRYVGGRWVWLEFDSTDQMESVKNLKPFHHLPHRYHSKNLQRMPFGSCLSVVWVFASKTLPISFVVLVVSASLECLFVVSMSYEPNSTLEELLEVFNRHGVFVHLHS
nr:hypothetical protein [Tanacetum cinerariifolium]